MSQAIAFIGGIHGAGKTTLSRRLALALSASHVTAGTLIREAASSDSMLVVASNKTVADVNANQEFLLQGLQRYQCSFHGPIVLDGHFSLLNASGVAVAIPISVYEVIAPIAIVLVESDCGVILSRLLERDSAAPPLATISSLSETERANARAVSTALKIPMFTVRGDIPTDEAAETAIAELIPLLKGGV